MCLYVETAMNGIQCLTNFLSGLQLKGTTALITFSMSFSHSTTGCTCCMVYRFFQSYFLQNALFPSPNIIYGLIISQHVFTLLVITPCRRRRQSILHFILVTLSYCSNGHIYAMISIN